MAGPTDASDDTRPVDGDSAGELTLTLRNMKTRTNTAITNAATADDKAVKAQGSADTALTYRKGRSTSQGFTVDSTVRSTTAAIGRTANPTITDGMEVLLVSIDLGSDNHLATVLATVNLTTSGNMGHFWAALFNKTTGTLLRTVWGSADLDTWQQLVLQDRISAPGTGVTEYCVRVGGEAGGGGVSIYVNRTHNFADWVNQNSILVHNYSGA